MDSQNEEISTGSQNLIRYECTKTILNQMEKCICKIEIDSKQGSGFFCQIPFPEAKEYDMLPIFITSSNLINRKFLDEEKNKISFDIKKDKPIKSIYLKKRKKYINEEYGITIIEIKEQDNIKNFLELDDNIINDILNNKNSNKEYIDETIYIIQYPEGKLSVSYGILDNIYEDKKYNFNHKCSTEGGSSGSPILNINNKLIGIHKEGNNNKNNTGIFLNYPIKEYIQLFHKNNELSRPNTEDKTTFRKKKLDKGEVIQENIQKKNKFKIIKAGTGGREIVNPKYKEKEAKIIQTWWRENKLKNKKILEHIIKIQSFWRGKFTRKYIYNIIFMIYLQHSFMNIIWRVLVNHVRPYVFKELFSKNEHIKNVKGELLLKPNTKNLLIQSQEYFNEWRDTSDLLLLQEFNIKYKLNITDTNITKLDLGWRLIGYEKFKDLCKIEFKELKGLYLEHNNLSDIKVLEKAKFEKLEILDLGSNEISDINILEKVNIKELKELYLEHNNISDINVLSNVDFEKLKQLNLKDNNFDKNKFSKIIENLMSNVTTFTY